MHGGQAAISALLGLCLTGIDGTSGSPSTQPAPSTYEWVERADAIVQKLTGTCAEHARLRVPANENRTYDKWGISYTTPTSQRAMIDSSARDRGQQFVIVRLQLLEIWKLTGSCLFADIPPEDLGNECERIITRYREFIALHRNEGRNALLRASFADNIDLIRTEYAKQAVDVIQSTIKFDRYLDEPGFFNAATITPAKRIALFDRLRAWWDANSKRLLSAEPGGRFINSETGSVFENPIVISDFSR